jgi:hypothetical protein
MNFWKVSDLANRLKNNEVKRAETLKYFIVMTIFGGVLFLLPATKVDTFTRNLMILIFIVYTISVLSLAFFTNRRGDNKEFIKRYVCIAFPIEVRMFVYSTGLALMYSLFIAILKSFGLVPPSVASTYNLIVYNVLLITRLIWIRKSMLYISGVVNN